MSLFTEFKAKLQNKIKSMEATNLFVVDIDKDTLWDTYLSSFPEGTNPVYIERTEHDCNCCKNFIRRMGGVVTIIDNKLISIWDVEEDSFYGDVAKEISAYVKSNPIKNLFLNDSKHVGVNKNNALQEDGTVKVWEHFYCELPKQFVLKSDLIPSKLGAYRSQFDVLKRSLTELTEASVDTVLELINQGSLYRGEEHKATLTSFKKALKAFNKVSPEEQDNYIWTQVVKGVFGIRNSVIGSLLVDLDEGKELEYAVTSFEQKVAPTNYKRPKALITKGMIKNAEKKVEELGIADALQRRHAVQDDITINNVLFADRSVKKAMNVFDEMTNEVSVNPKSLEKVEEISINDFIGKVVPTAKSIEMLFENRHKNNLMSLVAPVNPEAKNILKWGNNFSWSYVGEVADSMKENVKKAGGNVDGVLRFSIQWNTPEQPHSSDLDAHCKAPGGEHIYFANSRGANRSGTLDVDITRPNGVAVENIIYTDTSKMKNGDYKFYVNNYSKRSGKGFTAQVEFNGEIFDFSYSDAVNSDVPVATVTLKNGVFTMKECMSHSKSSVEMYGINTTNFHKVKMVMNSPNHWDGEETGNKHIFFILDGCKNEEDVRGFYNEFLMPELTEHRKVFEVLGSKTKVEYSEDQLSGLGFSTTKRDHVFVKVEGSFTRTLKVVF